MWSPYPPKDSKTVLSPSYRWAIRGPVLLSHSPKCHLSVVEDSRSFEVLGNAAGTGLTGPLRQGFVFKPSLWLDYKINFIVALNTALLMFTIWSDIFKLGRHFQNKSPFPRFTLHWLAALFLTRSQGFLNLSKQMNKAPLLFSPKTWRDRERLFVAIRSVRYHLPCKTRLKKIATPLFWKVRSYLTCLTTRNLNSNVIS